VRPRDSEDAIRQTMVTAMAIAQRWRLVLVKTRLLL
jgi:hypothetical protein